MSKCPHCHGEITLAAPQKAQARLRAVKRAAADPMLKVVVDVCRESGVSVADVLAGVRVRHVSRARAIAMHRLRHEHGLSWHGIGRVMQTDHSSAQRACRRVERWIAAGTIGRAA